MSATTPLAALGADTKPSGPPVSPAGNPLQLTLGTGAFAVCFAIFGSVSAMMPLLRDTFATPSSVHGPGQAARAAIE